MSRHEFKTPLLAIKAAVELLSSGAAGPVTASARRLISDIAQSARALEPVGEMIFRLAELCETPRGRPFPVRLASAPATTKLACSDVAIMAEPRYLRELFNHLHAAGFVVSYDRQRGEGGRLPDSGEMAVRMVGSDRSGGEGALALRLASRLADAAHGAMRVESDGVVVFTWRTAP